MPPLKLTELLRLWTEQETEEHEKKNENNRKMKRRKEYVSREWEKSNNFIYRSFGLLFVEVVRPEEQNTRKKTIEADLLYEARDWNAVFALVMNVERENGHRRCQGDDNDRDAVVQT